QEPWINMRQVMHFLMRETLSKRIADVPDTLWPRFAQFFLDGFAVGGFFIHAIDTDFQTAQRFLERFLESTTNRHHLTHRFHLCSQMAISLREFLESETRDLGNHVIDGRLERSWRCAA